MTPHECQKQYGVAFTVAAVMARFKDRLPMSLQYLQQHPKATARELFTFLDAEEAHRYYSNRNEVEKQRKLKKQQEERAKEEAVQARAIQLAAERKVALEEQRQHPWLLKLEQMATAFERMRSDLHTLTAYAKPPKPQRYPTYELNRLLKERKYWSVYGAHVSALVLRAEEEADVQHDEELTDAEMDDIATQAHEVAARACKAKRDRDGETKPTKRPGPEVFDRKKRAAEIYGKKGAEGYDRKPVKTAVEVVGTKRWGYADDD